MKHKPDLSPENPFDANVKLTNSLKEHELQLEVSDAAGKLIISYQPELKEEKEIPEPAKAAKESQRH